MHIDYQRGFAVNKRVDVVINSANGLLLLGTSGAGAIRDKSQPLTLKEKNEYLSILKSLPKSVCNDYQRVYKEHNWTSTYAQLGCLRLLKNKKGHQFRRGQAVLQNTWSKKDLRPIIHAIGMSYSLSKVNATRLPASVSTIRSAVTKALNIASSLEAKSIAIPVMCVRKTYGITPETSLKTIVSTIKKFRNSSINKVIICFDNSTSREYLKKLG
ncbi:hypothetical protein HQ545_06120 [Candidatus Woesearchaeota archaeon]|nr:hypothetical protein [Candidatus Woesearchaeota archaeon]